MTAEDPDLSTLYPCRAKQIRQLQSVLDGSPESWPTVFITGPTASGKSSVTRSVLQKLKSGFAWVNCAECFTTHSLCESVLAEVQRAVLSNTDPDARCTNPSELLVGLRECLQPPLTRELVLVFDNASYLLKLDCKVLAAIFRLHELHVPVVTVLVSSLPWDKFRFNSGGMEPVIVTFPAYSQEELVAVLSLHVPDTCPSRDFYTQYLRLFCSVFAPVSRDLQQLRRQATLNFEKYVEPTQRGEVAAEDTYRLWRRFESVLKRALNTVFLGEISSSQWTTLLADSDTGTTNQVLMSRHHVELPLYSKYLLIAAFLASYNPASSDARFFVKGSDKNMRKKRITKKGERTSNLVLGPKAFPLDRLLAIFHTIAESRGSNSSAVASQIASLVSLRLLMQLNATDRLEAPVQVPRFSRVHSYNSQECTVQP